MEAEGDDLDALVSGIGADQWRLPTRSPGWTIANQISHLASSASLATLAATDAEAFAARKAELGRDFNETTDAGASEFADSPPEQLLAHWRDTRRGLQDARAAGARRPPGAPGL